MTDDLFDSGVMGELPSARPVEKSDRPRGLIATFSPLEPATDERLERARKHFAEIPDARLTGVGRNLRDTEDGQEYRVVTAVIWEQDPKNSGVTAFAVRDEQIVYLRPRGGEAKGTEILIGEMEGRRVR